MSQLLTLISLKWNLLRNSMRSSKAVVNRLATLLGMLAALALALVVATGLGVAAYAFSRPGAMAEIFRESARQNPSIPPSASAEFLFFSIFAFIYLMWATLPLSIGSSKQFDAGKLLIYPISLGKLFAVDFVSEVTTLQSVFAIPAIIAMCIGAGLGSGNLISCLLAAIPITLFGVALSKWLSTSIGSLVRRKRTRGETILALVGAVAGLGGALAGQIAPVIFKHADSVRWLRWSPPGAAALMLAPDVEFNLFTFVWVFVLLVAYSAVLIVATYWIARRAALGLGGSKKKIQATTVVEVSGAYAGWELPLLSPALSAIVEKELRYVMRNAQLRMMCVMPLILIVVRLLNSKRFGSNLRPGAARATEFLTYGSGLIAAGGVLYVFLLLAGLSCNLFAFEEGGMRTLILSPVDRRRILIGKNVALTVVAFVFSTVLLTINMIVFRDLTAPTLLFVALSFISYAAIMSTFGNSLSIRFPKRMQFGKRLNVSGVSGLLLIPMLLVLALPPGFATIAGFYTESTVVEFLTLSALAALSVAIYLIAVRHQGESLAHREIEILEAVREPTE